MINFYRKTRKKIADDNKFFKYSRYAIGEIVLIVIGILMALQLNNWNVDRVSKLSQRKLLHNLVADLNYDIRYFNEIDSLYQIDLKSINYAIEEALSQKNLKLVNTNQMIPGRGSVLYLKVTKSTYLEMINTGLLYQLSDSELKNKINAYYKLSDFVLEKENRDNQNLNDWIMGVKTDDPKKIVMRLLEQRNLEHIDWSWLQNPNSAIYKEIETQIIWTKTAIESNLVVLEILKIEASNLKNEIQTYLNK